jgi:ABC-type uncharacterized transport system auxiliary subunit
MKKAPSRLCVIAVLLAAILCSGCVSRQSYAKHQFVLEAVRAAPLNSPSRDVVLAVRSFTIDPAYDSRSLLYRKGESEYESDFYNEFLVAPQVLISSQTRNWLAQSGVLKTVLEPGSLVEATHILEGNVLALYGDFRGQSLPQAVVEIRVFVVTSRSSRPEVVFTRDYRASQQAKERTADALVAALNQCLAQILSELEEDLGKVL